MKPAKKCLLAVVFLLPILLVFRAGLLLIAEPRITADYAAEYNRTCRPPNYNPAENAAPHYQRAFEAFICMPDELRRSFVNWPGDFDDRELALLEKWMDLNSQAFEHFRAAACKPYCWLERQTSEADNMFSIMLPELILFSNLNRALLWDAKLKAMEGDFKSAFEGIVDCYRATRHKCCSRLFLTTQHTGLGVRSSVIRNAFIILDKEEISNEDLEFFQNILQAELYSDAYIPNIQAERFFLYDVLQQTFIYNGRGTGRLAWSAGGYSRWSNLKQRAKECFLGPTKNKIVEQTEEVLAISNRMMSKTPWEVASGKYDYFEEIRSINNSNSFLRNFGLSPDVTFHLYHATAAQAEALITVLAVLRFRADAGRLPETLDELVSAGYLRSVPIDPYSGKALVYKAAADDFELYSVGEDFSDDGGAIEVVTRPLWRLEPGSTRTVRSVPPSDIIFWPVIY